MTEDFVAEGAGIQSIHGDDRIAARFISASLSPPAHRPENRYLNRELSWLAFNNRVLEEAGNRDHPLLERVKFLAISAANMEEFFMVRARLARNQDREAIIHTARRTYEAQQECWRALRRQLAEEKITLRHGADFSAAQRQALAQGFAQTIAPALTPVTAGAGRSFPFLPNASLTAAYWLADEKTGAQFPALVPLPPSLPRFVRLPDDKGGTTLATLEDTVAAGLATLFPGCRALGGGLVHVLRHSDLSFEDGYDTVTSCEKALGEIKRGPVVSVTLGAGMPAVLKDFLIKNLKPQDGCVFETGGMVGLSAIRELLDIDRPGLKFPAFASGYPAPVKNSNGDFFKTLAAQDIVLHHPYDSFDAVIDFLRQAAADPAVTAIRQTLYRTSRDSPVVRALIDAAGQGKDVTAVVELRARFDEEANIRFAREMEKAGVHVVYGVPGLKTHAKMLLVTRRADDGRLQDFLHLGTGNYHPVTAGIYTDISVLTADPALCRDADRIFGYLTGGAFPCGLEKLVASPRDLRAKFTALIDAEIAHARAGRPASIWAKVNALTDRGIIDDLYRASQAGVRIDLAVRGMCTLRPGVPGLSENITVRSIVGRFLEHSRVFCFGNGHDLPAPDAKVFISSADWMTRNLDRRVEYLLEVRDRAAHDRILGQIMGGNFLDNTQSWDMDGHGLYRRIAPGGPQKFSAQDYFIGEASRKDGTAAPLPRRIAFAATGIRSRLHRDGPATMPAGLIRHSG